LAEWTREDRRLLFLVSMANAKRDTLPETLWSGEVGTQLSEFAWPVI
jgi:hypothetical protein